MQRISSVTQLAGGIYNGRISSVLEQAALPPCKAAAAAGGRHSFDVTSFQQADAVWDHTMACASKGTRSG